MQLSIASTIFLTYHTRDMTFYAKCQMEGLVLSDEEAGREELIGFDEAMEVNSNTDFLR